MNNEPIHTIKTRFYNRYQCSAPLLFGFSLGAYEDELQRERNRKLYLKLKDLERKLINVKKSLTGKAAEKLDKLRQSRKLK